MKYKFDIQKDPDNDGYWSIYMDTDHGTGVEIAGKIAYQTVALRLESFLNSLSQTEIAYLFRL